MTSAAETSETANDPAPDAHIDAAIDVLVVGTGGGARALTSRLAIGRVARYREPGDLETHTQRADLVAAGAGVAPAARFAAAYPDRVRRLVLIAGAWPDPEPAGGLAPERSLVVWGAADRRIRPRAGERIVSTLGRSVDPATVEMITLPGVGHQVLDRAGATVAAIVDEFLR